MHDAISNGTGSCQVLTKLRFFLRDSYYSRSPIYRASRGKGIRPGKPRSMVYQGTFYTDLHIKLVFGGRIEAR